MAGFTGFPEAALDFYDDLETDNSKSYWAAHKDTYELAVRRPMAALLSELEAELGPGKAFRPYRDVRFAKDKTPYKTHQGGYVATSQSTGWYVQVSARGVMVGAGFYGATSAGLARFRDAIVDDTRGVGFERLVHRLVADGWELGGDRLRTTPRGYDADHPRIALLRHKTLSLSRWYGFDPVIHGPQLVDEVRQDWRRLQPVVEWVGDNATG